MDPAKVKKYCDETGKTQDAALMDDKDFKQVVYDELITLAVANKFNGLEKPKQICLLADPFTMDNDILTPTMKLKRNIAKKIYQEKIDAMYADTKLMAPTKK